MMKIPLLNCMITCNDSKLLKSVVTLCLILMHTVHHFITLNCPIQVDYLAESLKD